MVDVPVTRLKKLGFAKTLRRDNWWVVPFLTFLGLGGFVVYATWSAFHPAVASGAPSYIWHGGGAHYLSPFFSPELFGSDESWFGAKPAWIPGWLPFSPALLILWAPGGFRFTCYYYRGSYYKAFWGDPPACAVGEPHRGHDYRGEHKWPLLIQNAHRYFLYLALAFVVMLGLDAWRSMWFTGADGASHFGVGLGTILLTLNVVLIAGYTFGCHSFRHLIGGFMDRFSERPIRKACYDGACKLNRRHQLFAWLSLFCVAGCDVYLRLLTTGILSSDPRLF